MFVVSLMTMNSGMQRLHKLTFSSQFRPAAENWLHEWSMPDLQLSTEQH